MTENIQTIHNKLLSSSGFFTLSSTKTSIYKEALEEYKKLLNPESSTSSEPSKVSKLSNSDLKSIYTDLIEIHTYLQNAEELEKVKFEYINYLEGEELSAYLKSFDINYLISKREGNEKILLYLSNLKNSKDVYKVEYVKQFFELSDSERVKLTYDKDSEASFVKNILKQLYLTYLDIYITPYIHFLIKQIKDLSEDFSDLPESSLPSALESLDSLTPSDCFDIIMKYME